MRMPPRTGGGGRDHRGPARQTHRSSGTPNELQTLLGKINLEHPSPKLFDDVAQEIANTLRPKSDYKSNKRSQIRRFYDEMLRFEAELRNTDSETFKKRLPFLRMLNARAAYAAERRAEGGTLVDSNFTEFLKKLLTEVKDHTTLRNACTLFEAVIGFSPRDN